MCAYQPGMTGAVIASARRSRRDARETHLPTALGGVQSAHIHAATTSDTPWVYALGM